MANYAKLDSANTVIDCIYLDDDFETECGGESGVNTWATTNFGGDRWLKTSYNTHLNEHSLGGTPFRKNFGGVGMTYDEDIDGFIFDQPFDSWTLNTTTGVYEAPTASPGNEYYWDEENLTWVNDPQPTETTEQSVIDAHIASL